MKARALLVRAGLALLATTGGLLALGVGGLVLLTTERGNDWVRDLVVQHAPIPRGSLTIEELRFDLLSQLSLRGVSLRDEAGRELVGFDALTLRYGLGGLLERRLLVSELRLERPRVDVNVGPDGALDLLVALGLDGPSPAEPASGPWAGLPGRVDLGELTITDADIQYRDQGLDLHLRALDLETRGMAEGRVVRLDALSIGGRLASPGDREITLSGALALLEGDLALDTLTLTLGQSRIALDGKVGAVETAPNLDLTLQSELTPDDLRALAGGDPILLQPLSLDLTAQGPLEALTAEGALRAAAGQAQLSANVNLDADPIDWALTVKTPGLELSELLTAVTERTRLEGSYSLDGAGTRWPELPGDAGADLIQADVVVRGGEQVFWGEPVRDLLLDARVEAGKVYVTALSARHAVGSLSVDGDIDIVGGQAQVQGTVTLPELARLTRYGVDDLGGEARYEGQVAVDWSGPALGVELEGALSGAGLRAPGGVEVAELQLPLKASVLGSSVTASGDLSALGLAAPGVGLAEIHSQFEVEVGEDGSLSANLQSLSALGLANEDGTLTLASLSGAATGGLSGTGEPWGSWDLAVVDLALPTQVRGGGSLRGEVRDQRLAFEADLQSANAPLLVTSLSADLDQSAWEIATLTMTPTPGATWATPEAARFTLVEGGADAVHLRLDSSVGGLSLDGRLVPDDLDATLDLRALDLAWVADLARRFDAADPLAGLEGLLSGQAQIHSRAGDAPRLTLTLAGEGLRQEGTTKAPVDLDLALTLAADLLRLDGGVQLEERRLLSLGGEVPLELRLPEGSARLRCGEEITLRALVAPLPSAELGRIVPDATGTFEHLAADLRAVGDACDPELHLLASARVRDEARGQVIQADLDLARAGSDLLVSGALNADLVRRVQLDGTLRTGLSEVFGWALRGEPEPDLAALSTWATDIELNIVPLGVPVSMLGAPDSVGGTLAGGLQISGAIEDLSVAGGLQWMGGRVGNVAMNLGYVGLVPVEDGYTLAVLANFQEGGALALDGFIPMRVDLAGDLQAGLDAALSDDRLKLVISDGAGGHARVPVAVAADERAGLTEPTGDLELWGAITGTLSAPSPDIQARMYGGGLTIEDTGVRYEDITLDAELRADRLVLRELAVTSRPRKGTRRGSLRSAGEVRLVDYAPTGVSLDATLTDFLLSNTTEVEASASGGLRASGLWPDLTLGGDLRLGNTRIIRTKDDFLANASLSLSPDIAVYRGGKQVRATSLGERPPLYERFKLAMNVDLLTNLRLKVEVPTEAGYGEQLASLSSMKLDAQLGGALDVRGTIGAPQVEGTIETEGGTVEVLGASFVLEKGGTIAFVGGPYDNPILDLRAVRQTGTYGDVNVDITRDVAHVDVAFSADDYPDPSDALSLVLRGVPTSELTTGEGASLLVAIVRSGLTSQLEQAVGLAAVDQFEIDPTSGAVKVGKALSDSLFLTLEQRFSSDDTSENKTEASVEWMILRQLYADFVTGDAGKSSADIYWKWKF